MRSTFIPGPLSSIILEMYCFTAKTTFMVATWQVPCSSSRPLFLVELTPGQLAGSLLLPSRLCSTSGSPGSHGTGDCSSVAESGDAKPHRRMGKLGWDTQCLSSTRAILDPPHPWRCVADCTFRLLLAFVL
jgi:hypothetical protein